MKRKVKVWVYHSQQVSTWQGANGDKEFFSFKAKDSFMVVKQKVDNLTRLVFQARQKEMGKPSTPQKRTDSIRLQLHADS